jgi:hypothetical protein
MDVNIHKRESAYFCSILSYIPDSLFREKLYRQQRTIQFEKEVTITKIIVGFPNVKFGN